ncbi:alpha/beta hydrolase [Sphaerisporangium siamense]|uniref:Pimeloyl-ACP methyl ester carboxylesterase n=1 Tax=Sphaerisporangium siamense TaxID=795645 RepID=A0A7W7D6S8_9ACTN|nr:alpha/beta fold hydrolase [Sphaerisporangium siamense]MBB4701342.1 pimeloyl-ACP methyl ester carboxylesterase [Sphaerisporangium siamense]GII87289.1 alpha/beta hydrolase [Sphaerisporangium siamense]
MPLAATFPATLMTKDGVRIDAAHTPSRGDAGLGIVLAHGFTGSWRDATTRRIAHVLSGYGGVVAFDFRGHGRSGGLTTVGDAEVLDIAAAVGHARSIGYGRVATLGFSMGAAVAVRHAALHGGTDGVVAVSGPARWYYRGTRPMRQVHWAIEKAPGRLAARLVKRTRIRSIPWDPVPLAPHEAAARVSPVPFLIVHGDADTFFPLEHAHQLYEAAREPKELWIEPGYGHAESSATPDLIRRIGRWISHLPRLTDRPPSLDRRDVPDAAERTVPE